MHKACLKIFLDHWQGNKNLNKNVAGQDPLKLLKLLDGKMHTSMTIENKDDDTSLTIGGGPDLFLVNFIQGPDEHSFILMSSLKINSNKEIALVTGGQSGLFEERFLVSLNSAQAVLKEFVRTGKRAAKSQWHQDF